MAAAAAGAPSASLPAADPAAMTDVGPGEDLPEVAELYRGDAQRELLLQTLSNRERLRTFSIAVRVDIAGGAAVTESVSVPLRSLQGMPALLEQLEQQGVVLEVDGAHGGGGGDEEEVRVFPMPWSPAGRVLRLTAPAGVTAAALRHLATRLTPAAAAAAAAAGGSVPAAAGEAAVPVIERLQATLALGQRLAAEQLLPELDAALRAGLQASGSSALRFDLAETDPRSKLLLAAIPADGVVRRNLERSLAAELRNCTLQLLPEVPRLFGEPADETLVRLRKRKADREARKAAEAAEAQKRRRGGGPDDPTGGPDPKRPRRLAVAQQHGYNLACAACGAPAPQHRCAACCLAYYCSAGCQHADWTGGADATAHTAVLSDPYGVWSGTAHRFVCAAATAAPTAAADAYLPDGPPTWAALAAAIRGAHGAALSPALLLCMATLPGEARRAATDAAVWQRMSRQRRRQLLQSRGGAANPGALLAQQIARVYGREMAAMWKALLEEHSRGTALGRTDEQMASKDRVVLQQPVGEGAVTMDRELTGARGSFVGVLLVLDRELTRLSNRAGRQLWTGRSILLSHLLHQNAGASRFNVARTLREDETWKLLRNEGLNAMAKNSQRLKQTRRLGFGREARAAGKDYHESLLALRVLNTQRLLDYPSLRANPTAAPLAANGPDFLRRAIRRYLDAVPATGGTTGGDTRQALELLRVLLAARPTGGNLRLVALDTATALEVAEHGSEEAVLLLLLGWGTAHGPVAPAVRMQMMWRLMGRADAVEGSAIAQRALDEMAKTDRMFNSTLRQPLLSMLRTDAAAAVGHGWYARPNPFVPSPTLPASQAWIAYAAVVAARTVPNTPLGHLDRLLRLEKRGLNAASRATAVRGVVSTLLTQPTPTAVTIVALAVALKSLEVDRTAPADALPTLGNDDVVGPLLAFIRDGDGDVVAPAAGRSVLDVAVGRWLTGPRVSSAAAQLIVTDTEARSAPRSVELPTGATLSSGPLTMGALLDLEREFGRTVSEQRSREMQADRAMQPILAEMRPLETKMKELEEQKTTELTAQTAALGETLTGAARDIPRSKRRLPTSVVAIEAEIEALRVRLNDASRRLAPITGRLNVARTALARDLPRYLAVRTVRRAWTLDRSRLDERLALLGRFSSG